MTPSNHLLIKNQAALFAYLLFEIVSNKEECTAMIYETRHYVNDKSQRQYRLELASDLFGDVTVTAFYGTKRDVHYQQTLDEAEHFFDDEHQRRLNRHYRVVMLR